MCTVEDIRTIKNGEIRYKSGNKIFNVRLAGNKFRVLLLAENLNADYPSLYDLVIATTFNILDNEMRFQNLSRIDSFQISFNDVEGYKHSISKDF